MSNKIYEGFIDSFKKEGLIKDNNMEDLKWKATAICKDDDINNAVIEYFDRLEQFKKDVQKLISFKVEDVQNVQTDSKYSYITIKINRDIEV